MANLKAGKFPYETIEYRGANIQILRIIRGELFGDWPWGYERKGNKWTIKGTFGALALFEMVVRSISDFRDSVFFVGGEGASLPYEFPFPIFSEGAKLGFNDVPRPWNRAVEAQVERYKEAMETKHFGDDGYLRHGTHKGHFIPWEKRLSKAAFFATISLQHIYRTIVLDQAAKRPDLFDAGFGNPWGQLCSWNPLANETCVSVNETYRPRVAHPQPGDADFIWPIHGERHSNLGSYKYIIVTLGGTSAPSDRLENILAYSGSVVLLQESDWTYHFSSKLKPWVHYVPVSYSTADLTDKIEWLRAHDDMARRIAHNALNFGKSHLRLEDAYCYLAAALKSVESVVADTDAVQPWKPWKFQVEH